MPGRILNMEKPSEKQIDALLALADNPAVWVRNRYRTHEGAGQPIGLLTSGSLVRRGWANVQRTTEGDTPIIRLVISTAGLDIVEPYL